MSSSLGIDLGTYNSSAAVAFSAQDITTVKSNDGHFLTGKNFPSFVHYDSSGAILSSGVKARRSLALDPERVVWGAKRLVGISYDEAVKHDYLERFAYKIERGPANDVVIRLGSVTRTPSEVLEVTLRAIKEDAENRVVNPTLRGPFERAVVTVPAYYKAIRTDPIVAAALRVGFTEVETIAEPTAAAMRFGVGLNTDATLLAFDLGAGTLDVTLLQVVRDGDALVSGELCTFGYAALGGIDMDALLGAYICSTHKLERTGALMDEIEKMKIRLSATAITQLDGVVEHEITMKRAELEDVLASLLEKCRFPIRAALDEARLPAAAIDHVLLVGGPTYMPCVRSLVHDELNALGARPDVLRTLQASVVDATSLDRMECVCQGAALKGARIAAPVCMTLAEGYGIEVSGDRYLPVIGPHSVYPCKETKIVSFLSPNLKHCSVTLITKMLDVAAVGDRAPYTYEAVAELSISVTPTGASPDIEVSLEVSPNKQLSITLRHLIGGEMVRYVNPNVLMSKTRVLDESRAAERTRNETPTYDPAMSAWSQQHIRLLLELLQEVQELAAQSSNKAVIAKRDQLKGVTDSATGHDPAEAARLANGVREYIDLLRQPSIAVLSPERFSAYLRRLERIGT